MKTESHAQISRVTAVPPIQKQRQSDRRSLASSRRQNFGAAGEASALARHRRRGPFAHRGRASRGYQIRALRRARAPRRPRARLGQEPRAGERHAGHRSSSARNAEGVRRPGHAVPRLLGRGGRERAPRCGAEARDRVVGEDAPRRAVQSPQVRRARRDPHPTSPRAGAFISFRDWAIPAADRPSLASHRACRARNSLYRRVSSAAGAARARADRAISPSVSLPPPRVSRPSMNPLERALTSSRLPATRSPPIIRSLARRRGRTGVQLKDKWRNLIKFQHLRRGEAESAPYKSGARGPAPGSSKKRKADDDRSERSATRRRRDGRISPIIPPPLFPRESIRSINRPAFAPPRVVRLDRVSTDADADEPSTFEP